MLIGGVNPNEANRCFTDLSNCAFSGESIFVKEELNDSCNISHFLFLISQYDILAKFSTDIPICILKTRFDSVNDI